MDRASIAYPLKRIANARDPLSKEFPFYVLVETSGSNAEHDGEVRAAMNHVIARVHASAHYESIETLRVFRGDDDQRATRGWHRCAG